MVDMQPLESAPVDPLTTIILQDTRKVKYLGWLLIVLGPILSVGIAVIAFHLHDTIVHNDDPGSHSRWTGSPELTRTAFELFGAVFLFGLIASAAGVFQVRTGRRNATLAALMVLAVAGMLYLGYKVTSAVGSGH